MLISHRGGYAGGGAFEYVGDNILRKSGGGVILIVIQYRLGLFGFLPGQRVKDGGQLNAGLRKLFMVWIFVCLTFNREQRISTSH